ncbi:ankyrin and armadillo repeat-containing protein-like [Octopus vulgaris]|uniref:Ankyrin and armadillo repeat-containing protein-like n=1 Tax=Octopus vulgaris TaxID=6645 RepID=A0AA36B5Y5_OCTVU|nr:ankyrin and armadillo repeat-containing protein-like [Octopus vulgaris]
MLLSQLSIIHHEDLFMINAAWSISSKVVLSNDKADPETIASLNIYLQQQVEIVSRALEVKANMRRSLIMLKLVSFLTTLFVGMRKRMKIPHKDRLLKPYPGPSALHLAVQCGAFDAVVCLVCNFAQLNAIDNNGWTPIHCAAFYNQASILEVFLRQDTEFTEIQTQDNLKSTPLLLAATSGCLPTITTLLRYNADVTGCNLRGHNVIHTAVIHGHTRIVQYFIRLDMKLLPVWNILVDMLKFEDILAQESAVRCMEELILTNSECWINIYNSGI